MWLVVYEIMTSHGLVVEITDELYKMIVVDNVGVYIGYGLMCTKGDRSFSYLKLIFQI